MIKNGLPNDIPEITSPAVSKILCGYKAYKDHPAIAQFWYQTNDTENIISIIGCINGYVSLWSNNENTDELSSFLSFISPTGIFTHTDTAEKLKLNINESCLCFIKKPPFDSICKKSEGEPRDLLKALRNGLEIPDGDGFVADVSFRKYHGCAEYVIKDGGGALLYMNDTSAILNGIAVPKSHKRKGLGSTLLSLVLSFAKDRTVYACCTENNKNFYLKNGFTLIGDAAYCEEK